MPKKDIKNLETLYEITKEKLFNQMENADALDTKASNVMGFIGIIVGAIFGFTFFLTSLPWIGLFSLKLSTLFLISSFVFGLLTLRCRIYQLDPKPKSLVENYTLETYEHTIEQITHNFVDSYEKNENKLKLKARYINISLYLLLISIVILSIGIFMG